MSVTNYIEFEGCKYIIHPERSRILKRTSLDVYDHSEEGDEWVLMESLIFYSHRLKKVFKVPRLFITDLASIPKPCRLFFNVNGKHRYAAIIHDYLYCHDVYKHGISKEVSDKIFYDFMEVLGVPDTKALMIYGSVKFFGGFAWNTEHPRGTVEVLPPYNKMYDGKERCPCITSRDLDSSVSSLELEGFEP